MNFFAELRKRNVFRVLAAYLVGAWVMLQVVGFIADAAEMPEWTDTLVLIIVLLGLPIVAVAAWALELTAEGIKRSGTQTETEARPFGALDAVLSAAVVAVVGLFAWQTFSRPLRVEVTMVPPQNAASAEEVQQPNSIAVLPFVAISEEPEDVILGDGLAEELLNVLAQFPNLMVAGRTSSFSFRDRQEDIQAIGEELSVTHILEGSVRRVGDEVRITAQLIRVADGFHMWSATYDRPFAEVQQVQDEIVREIAQVLTIRLGATSYQVTDVGTASPAAYEAYLNGRAFWAERVEFQNRYRAVDAFRTATDIDPNFAAAWGALALAISYSGSGDESSWEEEFERAREAAERALELDPNNAEAWTALNDYHTKTTRDWAAAQHAIDRALELAPNAAYAQYQAGLFAAIIGDFEAMARHFRRATILDPLNLIIRRNSITRYIRAGRFLEARRLLTDSSLSDLDKADLQQDLAAVRGDAEAWREAADRQVANGREQLPEGSPVHDARIEQVLEAFEAALVGDRETFERLLETVIPFFYESGIPQDALTPAYLAVGDHREAARRIRSQYDGPEALTSDLVWYERADLDVGLRCQPDYHAIWELPGMAELAAIRRANGATGNLPLDGPECAPFLTEDAPSEE